MKYSKLQSFIENVHERLIEAETTYQHYHEERKKDFQENGYLPLSNEKCLYASQKCSSLAKDLMALLKEKEHYFSCNYLVCPSEHSH